jgi:hypothetical protein
MESIKAPEGSMTTICASPINLTPFCAPKSDPREYLRQPFSFETHSCSSNGHVAVVIPRLHSIPSLNKPELTTLLSRLLTEAIKKRGTDAETGAFWLDQFDPEITNCKECEGAGLTHVCPECEGMGELQPWQECHKCAGSGSITLLQMQLLRNNYTHDPGYQIKPSRCQTCFGIGKSPKAETRVIGSSKFSQRYLLLFKTLPNATVYAFGEAPDPALVVFRGGLGILMPLFY